jgi:hypothetical protein
MHAYLCRIFMVDMILQSFLQIKWKKNVLFFALFYKSKPKQTWTIICHEVIRLLSSTFLICKIQIYVL